MTRSLAMWLALLAYKNTLALEISSSSERVDKLVEVLPQERIAFPPAISKSSKIASTMYSRQARRLITTPQTLRYIPEEQISINVPDITITTIWEIFIQRISGKFPC